MDNTSNKYHRHILLNDRISLETIIENIRELWFFLVYFVIIINRKYQSNYFMFENQNIGGINSDEHIEEPVLKKRSKLDFLKENKFKMVSGVFLLLFGLWLFAAFISYIYNWKELQSVVELNFDAFFENKDQNIFNGKIPTRISHFLMYKQLGIAVLVFPIFMFLLAVNILTESSYFKLSVHSKRFIFLLLWLPVALGFFFENPPILYGKVGFHVQEYLVDIMGSFGTFLLIVFAFVTYLILGFNLNFNKSVDMAVNNSAMSTLSEAFKTLKSKLLSKNDDDEVAEDENEEIDEEENIEVDHLKQIQEEEEEQLLIKKNYEEQQQKIKAEEKDDKPFQHTISPDEKGELKTKTSTPDPLTTVNTNSQEKETLEKPTTVEKVIEELVEKPVEVKTPVTPVQASNTNENIIPKQDVKTAVIDEETTSPEVNLDYKPEQSKKVKRQQIEELEVIVPEEEKTIEIEGTIEVDKDKIPEALEPKDLAQRLVQEYGEYDPTAELANYQLPPLHIMLDYPNSTLVVNEEELQANKDKIVETLNNYKIEISSIKATIGPTVTLYEIIPAPGVRISKIKGLESDIALSLAALGIRIIAPLPGRGTVGIEVPNQNPKIVSMKSVLHSEKFQTSKMQLPVALGKTISNETFIVDLAKMPHLLMAGATGQGKSVGLNCILASLLYKKHPSELKFVLVDPKKVELTLFNHIERHFLAKLPGDGEAIITENKLVINTINSLCVEMDARYELLKNAHCRNIIEYNNKFKGRRLSPEKGHRFLPYIVLVVDEFADLIMTAGKEVELPIARLAQLARAIGIHLIIATQRPTTNIITGTIKANFPARIAFRVTSATDSRTILDAGGANQLIGRGDMLYTNGNDMVRLQCAFIDTPEVEKMCEFIGSQQGYHAAFELPEFVGEEATSSKTTTDMDERDSKFEDAARVVVLHQQGSTSLIQRKLKLGYNRAGRIMDQLEATGIVGPFEGSKARKVLIPDDYSLEQLLNELNSN